MADLPFQVGRIVNVGEGNPVAFEKKDGAAELQVQLPQGETRIFRVRPD